MYVDENTRRGVTVENRTCVNTAFLTQDDSCNILKYGTSYAGHLYNLYWIRTNIKPYFLLHKFPLLLFLLLIFCFIVDKRALVVRASKM